MKKIFSEDTGYQMYVVQLNEEGSEKRSELGWKGYLVLLVSVNRNKWAVVEVLDW